MFTRGLPDVYPRFTRNAHGRLNSYRVGDDDYDDDDGDDDEDDDSGEAMETFSLSRVDSM